VSAPFSRDEMAAVLARARQTEFYRKRVPTDVTAINQWNEIPLTSKSHLRQNYPFGLLAVPRSELATYHESSGTSGDPTPSYYTVEDWEDVTDRFLRSGIKLCEEDVVLIKTPYSLVMTAHQMQFAALRAGALVVPADNRATNITPKKVLRLLRDLQVSVTWAMPTETFFWAKASLVEYGEIRFPALRALWVAGEPLSPAKRERMESLWKASVYGDYGSTETGSLAGQCGRGNLHAWTDRIHFELIDETSGKLTRSVRGKIVVTPKYGGAMPLVRYDLEGCGGWGESWWCGSPFPVLRILGRQSAAITVAGVSFFPSQIEELIFSLPAEMEILFWRGRYDEKTLEIELETSAAYAAEATFGVRERIQRTLGLQAQVSTRELVPENFLKREVPFLKPRYLFSKHEDWNVALFY